ncbi:MAG: TonB family protein [Bacteroidales bacterium]|nr:TonB family protein [Bacteroidales bacterium]
MSDFMAYMIKANAAIIIFYAFYRLLIFKNTYFNVRRFSLVSIILFSAIYPFVDISSWLAAKEPIYVMISPYLSEAVIVADKPAVSQINIEMIITNLYILISLLLFIRMIFQIGQIYYLKYKSKQVYNNGKCLNVINGDSSPFSFFNMVFINPEKYEENELNQILNHEFTHVKEGHSIDVVLGEMVCCAFWFNPFVWLLKQEIRVNLEHLADNGVINHGAVPSEYQINLLKITTAFSENKLVNNFYIPEFKRRIKMMNTIKSKRKSLLKYAFLFPIALLLLFASNARAIVNHIHDNILSTEIVSTKDVIVSGVVKDDQNQPLQGVSIIIENTNKGTLTNSEGEYKIETPVSSNLVFSYIGFASVKKNVTENTKTLDVKLSKEAVVKDEVVAVAYSPKNQQTKKETKKDKKSNDDDVFTVVEQIPEFVGGTGKLLEYMNNNVKYPELALKNGIQGRVMVSFVVNKDGSISDVEVVRGVDPLLDEAAVKAIQGMPKWIPGKQKGQTVRVKYTVPVNFGLQKQSNTPAQNAPTTNVQPSDTNSEPIFTVVEDVPTFTDGDKELMAFLAKNIKYPVEAQIKGIQGKVIVGFVVNSKGELIDPTIKRGVDPNLDQEALRIVKMMPNWIPGKQRGKAVNVEVNIPIVFRLQ